MKHTDAQLDKWFRSADPFLQYPGLERSMKSRYQLTYEPDKLCGTCFQNSLWFLWVCGKGYVDGYCPLCGEFGVGWQPDELYSPWVPYWGLWSRKDGRVSINRMALRDLGCFIVFIGTITTVMILIISLLGGHK